MPFISSNMRRRDFLVAVAATAAGGSRLLAQAAQAAEKVSPESFTVIDAHLHMFNTNNNLPNHLGGVPREWATMEKTVEALRRGGVSKAFLISYSSMDIRRDNSGRVDPIKSSPLYSKQYMVDAWKKYPDLFYWFTDQVDPSRYGYLEDLHQDLEMGAAGAKILSAFHGYLPDHPGFMPAYELCRRYNRPVILDGSFWYMNNRGQYMIPYKESSERLRLCRTIEGFCQTLETVLKAFPTVSFSLAHTGTASRSADYDAIFKLMADHPNAYCDVAASVDYGAEWLQRLVKAVGPRKVMYGTDWPYWVAGTDAYRSGSRRWTMITQECPQLSMADKRLILAGNAERFLRNELADPEADKEAAESRRIAVAAWDLQRRHPVVVMHDHNPVPEDMPKMLAGGVTGKVYQFGLDVDPGLNFRESGSQREGWAYKSLARMEDAVEAIQKDPDHLLLALTAADFERAHREKKVAIMFGSEGGKLLEGKLEWLKFFHKRGLRELQLTWATPNQIVERGGPTGDGLTEFGRQVVTECGRLGVIVCLTHIPRRAFDEVMDLNEKPSIFSHEALGLELDEKSLKKLAAKGGVLGIHFFVSYLRPHPTPEKVADQVDKIAQVAGIGAAGLGCDFFPTEGVWGDFQRAQGTSNMAWAVPDISYVSRVTEALLARNYREDDIRDVLGGNFLRVCRKVFGS